ncbi:MAG: hypothetical protein AB1521_07725 [Bacteroidota bacterium]
MKTRVQETKGKKVKTITTEEIFKNKGFLGKKGGLLKTLMQEKKIERLR